MGVNLTDGNIDRMGIIYISLDLNNVNANVTATQSVTVPGLRVGDQCFITQDTSVTALTAGLFIQAALVTADDTMQVNIANITAAPINITARNFYVIWFRPYRGVALPTQVLV